MPASTLLGVKELNGKLDRLGNDLAAKKIKKAAQNAATPVVRIARFMAPWSDRPHTIHTGRLVVPGHLSRNIGKRSRVEKGKVVVEVGPKAEAFYGTQFVETGTGQARQPWLVPALEAGKAPFTSKLASELKRLVDKAIRS